MCNVVGIGEHVTQSIPYPTPSQQHERAVWRNRHFCKYLESLGLLGRPVDTCLVANWFKREWFGDERLGNKRLADSKLMNLGLMEEAVTKMCFRF